LAGVTLGFICFVTVLRPRPVVLGVGGAIALGTTAAWFSGFRPAPFSPDAAVDLLERDNFMSQLSGLELKLPGLPNSTWTEARQWAEQTQQFAERIAIREPTLIPELLETMHTVLDLSGQVAEALQVIRQIQTPTYRTLAQQRLDASRDRLQQTFSQMQALQDQMAIASLDRGSDDATLPLSLQALIADNKTILQATPTPSEGA
ncbi:MAG TPA: hypothetical protein V6C88_12305, partial [Chroococcidiopsis sp.]